MRSVLILERTAQILLICATLVGCKKHVTGAAPAPSASAGIAKVLPPNVDAALIGKLSEISKACKVDMTEGTVNCPQGEQRTLVSEFHLQSATAPPPRWPRSPTR